MVVVVVDISIDVCPVQDVNTLLSLSADDYSVIQLTAAAASFAYFSCCCCLL